jgi:hypothetical protein
MTRFGSCLPLLLLPLIAFGIVGCGGSRKLQSVALTPASADAEDFLNGQVSFVATGTFSKPPSPAQLTSKDVMWCTGSSDGVCVGNAIPGATVDQNGLAQCSPNFTGIATILAGTASSSMGNPDAGTQLKVFGSAQLTCP